MSILVISGPSGAGKSSIIKQATPHLGDIYFSISTTTRSIREGEVDGVDYHFVDKKSFEQDIKEGNFLEYAKVHENYYGTSIKPVLDALERKELVIFDIDVQGHGFVRNRLGDLTTSVFISPPTLGELKKRLENRSTDGEEVVQKRLENAIFEIESINEYDYMIINNDLEKAVDEFINVAKVARLKYSNSDLAKFIKDWNNL
ncbi:MAG: guanylate kinase [Campylobacterota bacterium]